MNQWILSAVSLSAWLFFFPPVLHRLILWSAFFLTEYGKDPVVGKLRILFICTVLTQILLQGPVVMITESVQMYWEFGWKYLWFEMEHGTEFLRVTERTNLCSRFKKVQQHHARLVLLRFPVATHAQKDCLCPAGKYFLKVLVYHKNKWSIKCFISILNLSLTAAIPVLAFKCHDLQCHQGFCFLWLQVMPSHAVLLF